MTLSATLPKDYRLKKHCIVLLMAFTTVTTYSQMRIKSGTFMYSKGSNIYVKEDINLEANATIYLRKEAQLMQASNADNAGAGNLSIFQEGASNNFTYNYWCPPVGEPGATPGNLGFLNSQIKYPTLQPGFKENVFTNSADYTNLHTDLVTTFADATILPTSVRDGLTDEQTVAGSTITQTQPLRIASRWLYSYPLNGTGYASWLPFLGTARVDAGYGFTMKGVTPSAASTVYNLFAQGNGITGQRYDFRGRPNNGTIQVRVVADDFALVGNPYPSALDLKQFLIDNTDATTPANGAIDTQILFWESRPTSHLLVEYEGGYASYIPGVLGDMSDNGSYVPATYKRYNEDGTVNTAGTAGSGGTVYGGATVNRRYAAVGQGFVINRTSTSNSGAFTPGSTGTAALNNGQRRFFKEDGNQSIFQLGPDDGATVTQSHTATAFVRPKINLAAVVNDLYVREFILAFGNDSTDGLDWGLEAVIDYNLQVNDLYMPQNGKRLIIKTIPFDVTKKVPVGFTLRDPSTLEISITSLERFDTPLILLHDKQTGAVQNLKNGTATVTLPAGNFDDRFEIVFEQPATLSTGSVALASAISVFQNNDQQLLTVSNPVLKDIKSIALYDLAGRLIHSQKTGTAQDRYTFDTSSYSSGIYLVLVTDSAASETAVKVSISN